MAVLSSLLSGLVFGLGLIISGMANPAKVLGFLDVTGNWDPSLALVMAGAIAVGSAAFLVANKRTVSLIGIEIKLPATRQFGRRLIVGSAVFGVGWVSRVFARDPRWWRWAWGRLKPWSLSRRCC